MDIIEWEREASLGSAHLLPRCAGGQDVDLGELSRVFLGLEAQRGDAGGSTVRRS